MCGLRARKEKRELIRVVRSPEGGISLDFKGKKPGRGAYLCPDLECLKRGESPARWSGRWRPPSRRSFYDELERRW